MNNFDVLKRMSMENKDIKGFAVSDNLVSAEIGKDGWGKITIAVDNATVQRIITASNIGCADVGGVLLIYGAKEFNEIREGKVK